MAYQAPLEGRRINIKSNSNSTIDNGTVTLQQGTGISLSQATNTITINQSGGSDFVQAYTSSDQTTNLAVGDHIKLNTVLGSSGSSISLDTTTGYTTTTGAASVGRFTLAANKTYMLYANITCSIYSASSGSIWCMWYNVTSGGSGGLGWASYYAPNARSTTQNLSQAPMVATVTTSVSTLVELQFIVMQSVSQLGAAGFGIYGASAIVHQVSP